MRSAWRRLVALFGALLPVVAVFLVGAAAERELETIGGENRRPVKRETYGPEVPSPPVKSWAPGSRTHLPKGELMLAALLRSDAWTTVYLPFVASQLAKSPGSLWSALDLECLLLVAIEHGKWIMGGIRNRGIRGFLTSEDGRLARAFLGFTYNRSPRRKGIRNDLSIPSVATISLFRDRVPWEERAAAAKRLFEALRDAGLELIEVQEACNVLYGDSYDAFITGIPESEDNGEIPDDEKPKRRRRLVAGAGRVGHRRADKPGGAGFKISNISCALALPIDLFVSAINVADKTAALINLLPALRDTLAKLPLRVRVMCADAAYWGEDLIYALMRLAFVPCVHSTSHSKREKSGAVAARLNAMRIPLAGSQWFANGHFELFCECGYGTVSARVKLGKRGRAQITAVCRCTKCGQLEVTAGLWRIVRGAHEFRRIRGWCPPKYRRPYLGVPYTFNDKRAKRYGSGRFGYQESFHGQLRSAYNVGGKSNPVPIESQAHLEYVVYIVAALMWANAIERIIQARTDEAAT